MTFWESAKGFIITVTTKTVLTYVLVLTWSVVTRWQGYFLTNVPYTCKSHLYFCWSSEVKMFQTVFLMIQLSLESHVQSACIYSFDLGSWLVCNSFYTPVTMISDIQCTVKGNNELCTWKWITVLVGCSMLN